MKVIPKKVTEQLGLLRVIDKSKAGEIGRNIFIELRDNIGFRGGRLTFIHSPSPGNHQKEQDYTIEKNQYIIFIFHNDLWELTFQKYLSEFQRQFKPKVANRYQAKYEAILEA